MNQNFIEDVILMDEGKINLFVYASMKKKPTKISKEKKKEIKNQKENSPKIFHGHVME